MDRYIRHERQGAAARSNVMEREKMENQRRKSDLGQELERIHHVKNK